MQLTQLAILPNWHWPIFSFPTDLCTGTYHCLWQMTVPLGMGSMGPPYSGIGSLYRRCVRCCEPRLYGSNCRTRLCPGVLLQIVLGCSRKFSFVFSLLSRSWGNNMDSYSYDCTKCSMNTMWKLLLLESSFNIWLCMEICFEAFSRLLSSFTFH